MPAIPPHSTATTTSPWDGPANKARLSNDAGRATYRAAFAWYEGDPEVKSHYRFIHHVVDANGKVGAANLNACSTGVGVLNGGRRGTTIPEADRRGVYAHLAKHLRDAGREPPPLKSLDEIATEAIQEARMARAETINVPLRGIRGAAWAVLPDVLTDVVALVNGNLAAEDVLERYASDVKPPSVVRGGSVAVIPLQGLITPRGSLLSTLFGGGGGLVSFRAALAEADADPDVGAIVLDVDSPGGTTDLVTETAADVRATSKPTVAVANTRAASAAYWIASQADEVVVTPSGDAGSIGVLAFHEDVSVAAENQGVKVTTISAGKFKAEGNPFEPLSEEARGSIQDMVDGVYASFVDDVAAGRVTDPKAVRAGYGEGRLLRAPDALEAGLVDRVDTLEGTLARMGAAPEPVPAPEATASTADRRRIAGLLIGKPDPQEE